MIFNSRLFHNLVFSLLLVFIPITGQTSNTHVDKEYSLKAVFTLNFARLTRWPANEQQDEITFCMMGNPAQQNAFMIVQNQLINSKKSNLKIIKRLKDVSQCQIVFISGISHTKLRRVYSIARNHPILTISEVDDISRSGAIINFVNQDEKVRFQINMKYAQQAGLKISSRLLKLAIITER